MIAAPFAVRLSLRTTGNRITHAITRLHIRTSEGKRRACYPGATLMDRSRRNLPGPVVGGRGSRRLSPSVYGRAREQSSSLSSLRVVSMVGPPKTDAHELQKK